MSGTPMVPTMNDCDFDAPIERYAKAFEGFMKIGDEAAAWNALCALCEAKMRKWKHDIEWPAKDAWHGDE